MSILIIEDDKYKSNEILNYIRAKYPNSEVVEATSYSTGIKAVRELDLDLLILDMSLPLYCDENIKTTEFNTFAGKRILEELRRIEKECKVIVVTAFDYLPLEDSEISLTQLTDELHSNFVEYFIGSVHYSAVSNDWKRKLDEILEGTYLK